MSIQFKREQETPNWTSISHIPSGSYFTVVPIKKATTVFYKSNNYNIYGIVENGNGQYIYEEHPNVFHGIHKFYSVQVDVVVTIKR